MFRNKPQNESCHFPFIETQTESHGSCHVETNGTFPEVHVTVAKITIICLLFISRFGISI